MTYLTRTTTAAALCLLLAGTPTPAAAAPDGPDAPGAPGATATFAPADKSGFGTGYGAATSRVWFTVQRAGGLGEIYYPDLDTPQVRRLEFVVAQGGSAVKVAEASTAETEVPDPRSLTFRQTNRGDGWRLVTTYVSDPGRATVLVDVDFRSLDGRARRLYVLHDPSVTDNGNDDTAATDRAALTARDATTADATTASALVAAPGFTATANGYAGTSDGWLDLRADGRLDHRYARASTPGNVVQTGETRLTGLPGHRTATLALGFGADPRAARTAADDSLRLGFDRVAARYAATWHRYQEGLRRPPASLATRQERALYAVSVNVLAASEDKANPGAFIASPTMPWRWGQENPSGPYHLVWSRDLYEIATALIAAGDRTGAERALDFLFTRQQKPDGSFPQNSDVRGVPVWTNLQLDEVAFPLVLAAQLGRKDAVTWSYVKKAADFLVTFQRDGFAAPWSPQERWENQSGYSPATIAAEIAGLVSAAGIATANGETASADRYLATADDWQRRIESWTVTRTGPYDPKPYYLRLTKDGNPDAGTTYAIGDSGPSAVDQRAVVDPSFTELVRLGVKAAADPVIRNSLTVVDRQLGYDTPRGRFWHRFTFDGYGETVDGAPWDFTFPADSRATRGRGWPIFNGERGEYAVAAGDLGAARTQLRTMTAAAGPGLMIAEQVWDDQPPSDQLPSGQPPSGRPGFEPGTGTMSATPLVWSHAQYVRLAVNLAAGRVTERPAAVACRYVGECGG